MLTLRTALRRLLPVPGWPALLRLCHSPEPSTDAPKPDSVPEPAADAEPPPAADRLAAWEAERNDRLGRADRCERRGLRLLARAALLRAAVHAEDRGAGAAARELRALAEGPGDATDPALAASPWRSLTLRILAADDPPDDTAA